MQVIMTVEKLPAGGDEYLDLVDDNDRVVGKVLRSRVYEEGRSDYRVVNGFVKNEKGQLWIPRRGPHKKIFPNSLDFSIGEHVLSGETYEDALIRGAKEELGVALLPGQFAEIGTLNPKNHQVASFMKVYEISLVTPLAYPKGEYPEAFWLYPDELKNKIAQGDAAKSDLLAVLNHFYPLQSTQP